MIPTIHKNNTWRHRILLADQSGVPVIPTSWAVFARYAGATIMGDGRIALILDVANLARMSGLSSLDGSKRAGELARDHTPRAVDQLFRQDDGRGWCLSTDADDINGAWADPCIDSFGGA